MAVTSSDKGNSPVSGGLLALRSASGLGRSTPSMQEDGGTRVDIAVYTKIDRAGICDRNMAKYLA
jgi:hypothetical protein